MAGAKGSTQSQLDAAAILELRGKRLQAVRAAYPNLTAARCKQLLGDFYRGKPGTAPIRRVIENAGLMYHTTRSY